MGEAAVDITHSQMPASLVGGRLDVNVGNTPTVTANAGTGPFPVSDNAGSLTIDGNVGLLAGTNNVGDVDVLTLPALVAGTANIGDVDVVSVVPGTTATSLGKAEDAPSADADVGIAAYSVRQDTIASSTSLDGDYQPLKSTSTGRLYASATIDAAIPVGTNNIGDVDVLTLPALVAGTANIGDVDVLTVPSPLSTTGSGTEATALRVTVATDSTGVLSVDDNGGLLSVDDGAGTLTVDAPVGTPVASRLSDGAAFLTTTGGRLSVDASGVAVPVTDNATTLSVDDGAGTLTVDGTITASNASGDVAHDGVDSGNPIKIGGIARQTNPTAVANLDRVNTTHDDIGRQVVVLNHVRDLVTQQTTTISTTTETTVLTAGAAGVFHDLTLITVANTSATDTRIDFRDATAGTVRYSLMAPANATTGFAPPTPVVQTTSANPWTAQLGTAVTDIRVFVQAVKNV